LIRGTGLLKVAGWRVG